MDLTTLIYLYVTIDRNKKACYYVTMNSNKDKSMNNLYRLINSLRTVKEVKNLFHELLTESEIDILSKRWRILNMLKDGYTQREIAKDLNVSLCKVTRGSKILKDKTAIVTKMLYGEKNE